jgi:diacylglycerol kinase (ATP)
MPPDGKNAPIDPQEEGYLRHLIAAHGYSWAGLRKAFMGETAFRIELSLCLVLTPLGLWLGDSGVERALLIGCLFLVLVVELLNSGIEAAIDRIGSEHHKLSARAKDVGSAAVMLSAYNVAVVWGLVLWDKL